MPRKARLTVPGAVHHIMSRGIEKQDIFSDDEDREYFLYLLSEGIKKTGYKCYAWVLMNNHYHILVRVTEQPLCKLMRQLNGRYAKWYRKKHGSRGYLFQDRYKSIVTQDQGYIEEIVRYINLNPVRAGICRDIDELDRYRWSSHAVLMNKMECSFQDTSDILRFFSREGDSGIPGYWEYIQSGISGGEQGDFLELLRRSNEGKTNMRDYGSWVIGDREFVKKAIESDGKNRLHLSEYIKKGCTVKDIAHEVASQMEISKRELHRRGRNNSRSILRKVVASISHLHYGIPVAEIARYYGVTGPSVSRMLDEGEEYAKKLKLEIKL